MISHNDFLRAYQLGTTTITVDCVEPWDNLVRGGLCEVEKNDTRTLVRASPQLLTLLEAARQRSHPPKTYFKNASGGSASRNSLQPRASRSAEVAQMLTRQVKMASPAYRAVVDGKKAHRDFIQEFAATLSNQDRADFWRGVMEMSDAEKATLASQLARRPRRGR